MRRLLPEPIDEVDAAAEIAAERRNGGSRPWLMLNMVASLDGATAVDGKSGQLGGSADREVFDALRAIADVILVAAGTVRDEGYGPPRATIEVSDQRRRRGQTPRPRLAVVSGSLNLDIASGWLSDDPPPLILTSTSAPPEAVDRLAGPAEIVTVGDDRVDLRLAVDELGRRGAKVILCEGGPSLNGQLLAQDLVDELDLTTAPLMVAGASPRVAYSTDPMAPARFRLERLFTDDSELFARYCRIR